MEEKTRFYYKELPENYIQDYVIDGRNKKTGLMMTILFFGLWITTFAICEAFFGFNFSMKFDLLRAALASFIFIASYIVMIILHELIHGLFNKIFTREKLTFGFGKGSAYCGAPEVYIKKGAKMVVAMAPFFTFSIALITALIFIKDPFYYLLVSIFLGLHIGGCSGDLAEFFILLFKYHGKKVLVNDIGPVQTIYAEKKQ